MEEIQQTLLTAATILSGFSTVAIAVLTFFLWRENRALRKAGFEPNLVAFFESHPDGTGGLNISIANIGTGPAKDVYIDFIDDESNFAKYSLILDCYQRGPMTLIPQEGKISFLFATGFELFKTKDGVEEPLRPFKVALKWTDLKGSKSYKSEYILDVEPYGNLPGLVNKPHLLKIADSINDVSKSLSKLNSDVTQIRNIIHANELREPYVKKYPANYENNER